MSHQPGNPQFITRLISALFFDRRGTINPAGGVQVFCMGEVAVLFSLLGRGFYENVAERGLAAFQQEGLKYVYASVSDAHLRLMRGKLSKVDVAFQFKNRTGGHELNWVLITAKGDDAEEEKKQGE